MERIFRNSPNDNAADCLRAPSVALIGFKFHGRIFKFDRAFYI